jgi:hypothetical protein
VHLPIEAQKRLVLLACFKTLLELVQTSARINKLLLAGKEGVALRANFNSDIALGGLSYNSFAARALDSAFFVIGVNSVLHSVILLFVG